MNGMEAWATATLEVDMNVNAAYINFTDEPIVQTVELTPYVLVDVDETGAVVGVEFLGFNRLQQ